MRQALAALAVLAFAVASVTSASAHSLDDLEAMLGDKEEFFQPLDRESPDFSLQSTDGEPVRLSDFLGKVVVLNFIYAGCPDVCPLHAERIAEVQEMVNQTPMKELVQFITITTDPENDTPEVLSDYGRAHGLDSANWIFLTKTPDQPEDITRTLAESFGHTFTLTEDGYQVHGVVTHVIDSQGRWRGNFHGLRFEPTNLVLFINGLTNAGAPHGHSEQGFWNELLSLFGW